MVQLRLGLRCGFRVGMGLRLSLGLGFVRIGDGVKVQVGDGVRVCSDWRH